MSTHLAAAPSLVAGALARLETLIGLAPGDVSRRRLERHIPLLTLAATRAPDIDDPAWADVIDAVTIQETRLFRHPAQCLVLHDVVLPRLIATARDRGSHRLRLLCAGCATGEEAWTLAVIAAHALASDGPGLGFEVVAVDLSRPALRAAAQAIYAAGPPDPLRDVPPAFHVSFPAHQAGITVAGELTGKVRFRRANLLALGPDHLGFDAIMCRNVGIYLTSDARAAVMRDLAARLLPGGALLVGPTDSVPRDAGLQAWSADTVSIYRRPLAPP